MCDATAVQIGCGSAYVSCCLSAVTGFSDYLSEKTSYRAYDLVFSRDHTQYAYNSLADTKRVRAVQIFALRTLFSSSDRMDAVK